MAHGLDFLSRSYRATRRRTPRSHLMLNQLCARQTVSLWVVSVSPAPFRKGSERLEKFSSNQMQQTGWKACCRRRRLQNSCMRYSVYGRVTTTLTSGLWLNMASAISAFQRCVAASYSVSRLTAWRNRSTTETMTHPYPEVGQNRSLSLFGIEYLADRRDFIPTLARWHY